MSKERYLPTMEKTSTEIGQENDYGKNLQRNNNALGIGGCWATSYGLCEKRQIVNLKDAGYDNNLMDKMKPPIRVCEWYCSRFDCGCEYHICVRLLNANMRQLDKWDFTDTKKAGSDWIQVEKIFERYPSGVRYIEFRHGGKDTQFWAGHFGVKLAMPGVFVDAKMKSNSRGKEDYGKNMLRNNNALEGMKHWEILMEEGDGFSVETDPIGCKPLSDFIKHENPIIPVEILRMDNESLKLYKKALQDGTEKVYNIRVMVVGQLGAGKTTLTKRLLEQQVDISERKSTEGIDVHKHCCKIALDTGEWIVQDADTEQDHQLQRIARVLTDKQSLSDGFANETVGVIQSQVDNVQTINPSQGVTNPDSITTVKDKEIVSIDQKMEMLTSDTNENAVGNIQAIIPSQGEITPDSNAYIADKEQVKEERMREMLKLLQENTDQLKQDKGKVSPLSLWDFAGQYAFYTTHQTFLTRRAIYLLVSDVSGQVTDLVDDECFIDSEGKTTCRVHELTDVWLNSIHSCALSSKPSIPPVILVGTHVDKIGQKQLLARGVELESETMSSITEEFTPPTTSIPAAASTGKQANALGIFRFVKKIFKPRKAKGTVEATPVSSMTGDCYASYVDHPKKKRKWRFWQRMKNKRFEGDTENVQSYRYELCDRYFREVRSYLRDKPTRLHLVDEDFAIDNTIKDRKLEDLKRKIVEVASQQPYWGEEIPARWLLLEQELMKLKAAGIKVIPLTLMEDLNKAGAVQITTDELNLFLRFHHDIGTVLYFSLDALKEQIVLDPQWMIDALKSLITAEIFVLRCALAVAEKWYEFKQQGKLYPELIDAVWSKEKNIDLHDNKKHILLLMEHLNIIARPKYCSEEGSEIKEENYFLAPCMLQQKTPAEVIYPKPNDQMESSSVLCYVFLGKFLPSPIFHRLLAACVAHWPISTKKKKETQENQIFCGCCVFQLDQHHKLILHFRKYVIYLRVIRMGIKEKTPSSKLCIEARMFITTNLRKIIGYLGQSLNFEYFIQCAEYSGESVNSLIPVSDLKENAEVRCDFHDNIIESCKLMKYWFKDNEQSEDVDAFSAGPMPSPPTSDTDRFMCIAYLLNDVGSKVLRKLFHHMVVTPSCNLDQYLANYRSTIESLLKKRVLNPSQMDIMFPPNGDGTNLDDYDITLLSALFHNIVPSMGHQERNLVKGLRDDRNKLYGHTKSCKMIVNDFQTCWSKISSTLIKLSQLCGDPNFENDMLKEIQQTRVPDASYLSILKAWFNRIESTEERLKAIETSSTSESKDMKVFDLNEQSKNQVYKCTIKKLRSM